MKNLIDLIMFIPPGKLNGSIISECVPGSVKEILWVHPVGLSGQEVNDLVETKEMMEAIGILPFSLRPDISSKLLQFHLVLPALQFDFDDH